MTEQEGSLWELASKFDGETVETIREIADNLMTQMITILEEDSRSQLLREQGGGRYELLVAMICDGWMDSTDN